ncbi:hypothetical protein BDV59DRAFT_210605 [Aspergillus ambiguus]|uniref:uncharacterized protein n=1 Tax=Aspergillus ambiguus TaxID=176160 RepID=UPI003CCD392F
MQKKRRNSFCTAGLPNVTSSFDDFFHVERTNLATLPRASFSRPGTPVSAKKMMALPQIDGPSEKRKTTKKRNQKKKAAQKRKKKAEAAKTATSESDTPHDDLDNDKPVRDDDAAAAATTDAHDKTKPEPADPSGTDVMMGSPMIVDASSSSSTIQSDGPTAAAREQPNEATPAAGGNPVHDHVAHPAQHICPPATGPAFQPSFCRVHGHVCVSYQSCCVHASRPAGCTCPPRWSCCCLHHSGDCCHCRYIVMAAVAASVNNANTGNASSAGNVSCHTLSPIAQHLLSCFERDIHSDFVITLRSSAGHFPPISVRVHTAIVSRSPLMEQVLRAPHDKEKGKGVAPSEAVAVAGECFTLPTAFHLVLKYLYGKPLLTTAQLRAHTLADFGYTETTHGLTGFCVEGALTDAAVCYAAAGAFFRLREVVDRGVQLAVESMALENVDVAFWLCRHIRRVAVALASGGPNQNAAPAYEDDHPANALEETATPRLTMAALRVVLNAIDDRFVLDVRARCEGMPDRIPEQLCGPRAESAAAEASGSAAGARPMGRDEKLSAVVLALGFVHLRALFVGMGLNGVMTAQLAETIVLEREKRRMRALQELTRQADVKLENDAVSEEVRELGYREFYTSKAHADLDNPGRLVMEIGLDREWTGLVVKGMSGVH